MSILRTAAIGPFRPVPSASSVLDHVHRLLEMRALCPFDSPQIDGQPWVPAGLKNRGVLLAKEFSDLLKIGIGLVQRISNHKKEGVFSLLAQEDSLSFDGLAETAPPSDLDPSRKQRSSIRERRSV